MEPTVFNPVQIHLLKMFQRKKSEADLLEVKKVLSDYYAKKLDAQLEKMWESGELDQKRLDEINEMDLHEFMRNNR
ncbi:MAG: hypothetical protein IKH69_05615 [Bacteroidaceae bacterium]|nr:hypothetical protein [Bacteroidaceae bacterium]MBR3014483.1 hypothetical protein [Bacteroidaceae bacterium]